MTKTVIQVNNLSKRYRIGLKEKRHDTFVGQLGAILKAPIDNFRQLRSMSKFGAEDESVFWALKDINFEVKEGEVLGIIGHNGAGKSTLLKILSRITEPTSGEIKIKGRISALLEVGTGFHPDLTGRENVYMNGTILGMTKREIDAKFDEIVDFSGVEKYIDTPVKFYSSGMKVRLGFAVAAHLEPEILIIDEVLAVGDAEFQQKCLGKMEDVSKQGRTVLFVSHDMGAIAKFCPRVMLLNKGGVINDGSSEEAITKYLNLNIINAGTNLLDIKERSGSGEIRIVSLEHFTEIKGVQANEIISGEKVTFKLTVKKKFPETNVSDFFVNVGFFNSMGSFLFQISSLNYDIKYNIVNKVWGEIYFSFDRFPLAKGDYILNVFIASEGEVYDWIKNALKINVIEGNFFPGKSKVGIKQGVLIESNWN